MTIWKALAIILVTTVTGLFNALNDDAVTTIEVLIIVGAVLGSGGVVWYAQNGPYARYVKAVVGALAAFITAVVTGLDDGLISHQEWTAVLLAVIAGAGFVYLAPPPPPPRPVG